MTPDTTRRIRGALAALALLAFVAGIPCVLLAFGADPARLIPDRWPDPAPISQWPDRIWTALRWAWLTGDLVTWLIMAVAWAGWLALTLSVTAEVIRQTGHGLHTAHGLARRVPRGQWIAGLVAAVIVATPVGTAAAAGTPAAPAAATAPPWPHTYPGPPLPAPEDTPPTPAADAAAAVPATARHDDPVPYTVLHGDTLWGLAERHLGAGVRYHEIVWLNLALLAHTPDDLQPGWTLRLPADAVGLPHPAEGTVAGRTVTVRSADTLTGIAECELDDPNAWRVLFDLNAGRPQPDGRALRHPDQILPGWNLVLPNEAATLAPAPPQERGSRPRVPAPAPARPHEPAASAARPVPQAPRSGPQPAPAADPGSGISLSTGAFVGLGLAALITIAMITVRLRRRRWYQPGAPDHHDDPAGAPVVRALRIAHDTATRAPDQEAGPATAPVLSELARPADLDTRDRARATVRAMRPSPPDTVLGVRDGQSIALDLACTHGLGLVGPGAGAGARALLVTLLAQATSDRRDTLIVIPALDARTLFGNILPERMPQGLRVVEDLPAALDLLETELLTRTHPDDLPPRSSPTDTAPRRGGHGLLLLVATPTTDTERRTCSILDNGSPLRLAGVFLGPWRPGRTAHVRSDGTVDTSASTVVGDLAAARLFTLPETDARDLLTLLHAADTTTDEMESSRRPAASGANPGPHSRSTATHAEQLVTDYDFTAAAPGPAADTTAPPPPSAVTEIPGRRMEETAATAGYARVAPEDRSATSTGERTASADPSWGPRPAARLHLQILGRLRLIPAKPDLPDLIDVFAPRQREILVYLALHRDGCRRETLSTALWPDAPGDRPYNSFHATLSQLRRSLRRATGNDALDLVVHQDRHYGLDQATVTTDLWQLQDALTASRRHGPEADVLTALRRVTELYRGDLAEGISADWIDGPREALRRDVLDALSTVIRAIRNDDPEQALTLLEQARRLDPYNEAIYRDLMRLHARLGRHDNIPRTLQLLTTALSELDQRPAHDTLILADALNQRASRQAS